MAAPNNNRSKPGDPLFEKTREKIQTTQLINRLQANALGELDKEMSASQIQSAKILIDRTLPTLQSTELKGDEDNPLNINVTEIALVAPDES